MSTQAYAGNAELKNPLISPLFADYTKKFPPAIIQTGTRDLLLSDCVRLYRVLSRNRDAASIVKLAASPFRSLRRRGCIAASGIAGGFRPLCAIPGNSQIRRELPCAASRCDTSSLMRGCRRSGNHRDWTTTHCIRQS
ncbi:MAG: alpha/beta hydrolase fold domain-containing protein [Thermoguttaceae bacterium]|nr:alpha/beta hydrolase fold domain-containing protein [Thermoguttaceae bacterium]